MSVISLEIEIKSPLASIWHAWTSSETITEWFPPEANIEPRLGGAFELFFDPNNHSHQSTIGCVFTAFKPNSQIAFTWKGPNNFADFMNIPQSLTHVTISFVEEGDHVIVKLEHTGWGEGPQWEGAENWHREQWQNALNDLKQTLESK